jgi:hypothetical protein
VYVFPLSEKTASEQNKTTKINVSYILIFTSLDSRREQSTFRTYVHVFLHQPIHITGQWLSNFFPTTKKSSVTLALRIEQYPKYSANKPAATRQIIPVPKEQIVPPPTQKTVTVPSQQTEDSSLDCDRGWSLLQTFSSSWEGKCNERNVTSHIFNLETIQSCIIIIIIIIIYCNRAFTRWQ